ncbi:argininosuccinate lyase [Streptococcus pneumoniae]|nr:argininosuccinate lyase [Streptococcus pneumoniae]MDS4662632.1 argininosuccinate lyase [Streptococcus pneumoniae]MDS5053581.1 argininosuccinate lyase [Streptococcus pneumoniae]MDS5221768.1 argininosuccinate lyase [Streptococcus pneumoniae]MDS8465173.1 argininosuccinate lyase [Streptococcus pneumoniae]
MDLVLPNNYVALEQEEMIYLDGGGAYLSKRACQGICAALAMSPGTLIALAGAAVLTKKLINYIKVGGLGGWLIGAAAGVLATAAGKIAYCIGYGALNRGCDISGNPYPWDGFISATVR